MRKLFTLLFLITSILVNAQYHISTTGSDLAANDGITKKWKTLAYACTRVKTIGSYIHVDAGTYNETVMSQLSPGVSIEGDGPGKTIININHSAATAAIILKSNSLVSGNQFVSNITLSGNNLSAGFGILINYRNYVTISNIEIKDFFYCGIYAYNPDKSYMMGLSVHDCIINNSTDGSQTDYGSLTLFYQKDMVFYNNNCSNVSRSAGANGFIIKTVFTQNFHIYNNIFTKNDKEADSWNFFFELWENIGTEINNNTFKGGALVDLVNSRKGAYAFGIKVHDNNFSTPAQLSSASEYLISIVFEEHGSIRDVYVYNNTFTNIPNGVWFSATHNDLSVDYDLTNDTCVVDNVNVYNNLFTGLGLVDNYYETYGISFNNYAGDPRVSWNNINVYNNTLVSNPTNKSRFGIYNAFNGTARNIKIYNNIIQGFVLNPIAIDDTGVKTSINNYYIQNNCLYENGNSNAVLTSITPINYVNSGNINSNPLLTSTYILPVNSPCIKKGLNGVNIGKLDTVSIPAPLPVDTTVSPAIMQVLKFSFSYEYNGVVTSKTINVKFNPATKELIYE